MGQLITWLMDQLNDWFDDWLVVYERSNQVGAWTKHGILFMFADDKNRHWFSHFIIAICVEFPSSCKSEFHHWVTKYIF